MRIRRTLTIAVAAAMAIGTAGIATAHAPGVADGHVAANQNYGFTPVGYSPLEGVQDGRYTDVWVHEEYAYVGSFQDPTCSNDGVYIADISNPADPTMVKEINSPPGTRVNDVKVTSVGDMDVLIMSHEVCGTDVAASNASQMGRDRAEVITDDGLVGQGYDGISLYDVTRPRSAKPLVKGFLETEVHNTFPWTTEDGTFLLVVDDFNVNDTWVVDISNPRKPELLIETGLGDWLDDGTVTLDDELFLGSFATPLLHDIWVEFNPTTERWEAVLSYWDLGFVTLDMTDPAKPVFIDDSDYPEDDPVLSEFRDGPEGNAHAAVFGGNANEFIFGGDEDFDVLSTGVTVDGTTYPATTGSDTPALDTTGLTGTPVYVGLSCAPIDDAPATDGYVAVVVRGDCAFTDKVTNAEAANYDAVVVFNQDAEGRCEASLSMLVDGGIPAVFVPRSAGFAILGVTYDGAACGDGSTDVQLPDEGTSGSGDATLSAVFDGWGYFWVLNNTGAAWDVSGPAPMLSPGVWSDDVTVEPMGTLGYYAPAEVSDPTLAAGAGDLTMHNLETDDLNRDRTFISWYSAGMRALEWREGHFHATEAYEGTGAVGSDSWNIHEVGRWIAGADDLFVIGEAVAHGLIPTDLEGSNFWGVTQTTINDTRYVVASDRNTGLWIFEFDCGDGDDPAGPLYCGAMDGG